MKKANLLTMNHGFICALFMLPTGQIDGCDPTPVCDEGCEIDSNCYVDGEVNPENPCQICDVAADDSGWSAVPVGTPCDYCLQCDADASCSEKDEDCCTVEANDPREECGALSATLLKPGCRFTSGHYFENNMYSVGASLTVICEPGGWFNFYDETHSLPNFCGDNCEPSLSSIWRTDACEVELDIQATCPAGCIIENVSYLDGAHQRDNLCRRCTPAYSTSEWEFQIPGTPCDENMLCDYNGTCSIDISGDS